VKNPGVSICFTEFSFSPFVQYKAGSKGLENETLKGSLSVLKLMPGTYLSQTGNPLSKTEKYKNERKTVRSNP
jgi:hypothetical protein